MSGAEPFHYLTDTVVSERPFTLRRRVKWGDTDAAGVVYTPRFVDYVVETSEAFNAWLLGGPPYLKRVEHGFGTPMKAMSFEFNRSLYPDDQLDIRVHILDIRTRTYDMALEGWSLEGENVFRSMVTPIILPSDKERRSVPIPDFFRELLEGYRRDNPPPPRPARA